MIRVYTDHEAAVFEQDIRELCRAFYPGEEFVLHLPDGKGPVCTKEQRCAAAGKEDGTGVTLEISGTALRLTGDRKRDKSKLKRELYRILSELSGKELPWGTLTGIRPVSLVSPLIEAASEKSRSGKPGRAALERIRRELKREYLIREDKLSLMLEIAVRENRILRSVHQRTGHSYREGWSLYIGIPFCPTRCLYCSFPSNPVQPWEGRLSEYLQCLRREIRYTMQELCGRQGKYLQTIYIGGGTPTALPEKELRELMQLVEEECLSQPRTELCEFTVEAGRPDSITREKLLILREAGVSRISVNPQSFHQKTLDLIGRRHTVTELLDAYRMARELGFQNINMDIILGLPGERLPELTETLCAVAREKPDSLTVHSLAVKRAARLSTEKESWQGIYRAGGDTELYPELLPGSDASQLFTEMERMMLAASYTAELLSLRPYYLYRQKNMAGNLENVGFCEEGKECLYNILMMEEKHAVIGCGVGCSSKLLLPSRDGNAAGKRVERADNPKDIRSYLGEMEKVMERKKSLLRLSRESGEDRDGSEEDKGGSEEDRGGRKEQAEADQRAAAGK